MNSYSTPVPIMRQFPKIRGPPKIAILIVETSKKGTPHFEKPPCAGSTVGAMGLIISGVEGDHASWPLHSGVSTNLGTLETPCMHYKLQFLTVVPDFWKSKPQNEQREGLEMP